MIKRAQGRNRFGMKNFKKRWFRLTNHEFTYHKAKGEGALCRIPIENILAVERLEEESFKMKNVRIQKPTKHQLPNTTATNQHQCINGRYEPEQLHQSRSPDCMVWRSLEIYIDGHGVPGLSGRPGVCCRSQRGSPEEGLLYTAGCNMSVSASPPLDVLLDVPGNQAQRGLLTVYPALNSVCLYWASSQFSGSLLGLLSIQWVFIGPPLNSVGLYWASSQFSGPSVGLLSIQWASSQFSGPPLNSTDRLVLQYNGFYRLMGSTD
uniref:PH domain-containing protein n=1 Tax=Hucho hucho TaxID=62062 RepID=A0A4W5KBA0_9TELE